MKLQEQDVFAGRYRLLRRIGSGGFSVVWLAADQMTEDSEVALKIYVPEKGMDSQGIKMFVREYKIVADMNHSGLLKATHFDVHDGSPFLVMPFCSAGSLHSRMMERGAISEGEIAEVLEQTAGALAYLHREEVVHQDIKPDNVLINDRGEYLLTDFGISSRMRSTMRKSTDRKVSMTVAYAPPERFGGKSEVLPAGDVFSLGVMIYELATGEVPWMAAGGAMLHPDSSPLELPEGYSRELELLMQACVSYSPGDRPTAEDLQAAASSYRNSGRWGAVSGRKRKAGGLWWLWVLVALVVLGGGYGVYTQMDNFDPTDADLTIFESNGYYGVKNSQGELLLPARFDKIENLSSSEAKVYVQDSVYITDMNQRIIRLIEPTEEEPNEKEEQTDETSDTPTDLKTLVQAFNEAFDPGERRQLLNRLDSQLEQWNTSEGMYSVNDIQEERLKDVFWKALERDKKLTIDAFKMDDQNRKIEVALFSLK